MGRPRDSIDIAGFLLAVGLGHNGLQDRPGFNLIEREIVACKCHGLAPLACLQNL